ncbi:Mitogen-activated protein kinase-binding protein 1 [Cyberlindnera fabianii]|uniref:Mitogen-activated protein kinase-binding protein 1 n=1 Tax=Cyberlindnera fabianii TaxID=36022 RepID=A0A1V2L291_CYBFA|nr:Mitogen-activated protein kinase-binding protein 1 [Cyberlindnera fabianii]
MSEPSLLISRIYGTSSDSQRTFAASSNLIAYIASGGVVVCSIDQETGTLSNQRFFCATNSQQSNQTNAQASAYSYLNMMGSQTQSEEKDSFGLPKVSQTIAVIDANGSTLAQGVSDMSLSSPQSKLSSQRIKTISCIAISPDEKLLAVGESGTQPRILLFSLAPDAHDFPFLSIAEHSFGVSALHFSPDSKYLLSIGDSHDGFIFLWRLGGSSVSIAGANKCTSQINGVTWLEDTIVTYGVRHIKIWKFEEFEKKSMIQGKNVILGDFINGNFVYATPVLHNDGEDDILFLTSLGEVCGYNYLNNNLTLRYVNAGSPKAGAILSDIFSKRVWIATDKISELPANALAQTLTKESDGALDSPTKVKFLAPITCMKQISERYLVYITSNEEIQLLDVESGESRHLIESLSKSVNGVKKTSSGKVVSWTKEGVLKTIDTDSFNLTDFTTVAIPEVPGMVIENHLTALDVTSDGQIVIGDAYGNLTVFDEDGAQSLSVQAHEFTINDVCSFQISDFQFIVSIGRDRMIQVFARTKLPDVQHDDITNAWGICQTLADHRGNLLQLVFHENRLYVSSADRSISVHSFALDSGVLSIKKEKTISLKSSPTAMTISNDELVVSTMDKQLSIFNITTLESTRTLKLYTEDNETMLADNVAVISPNQIACSCTDKSIRVFNFITGRQISVHWGHSESIKCLLHVNQHLITLSANGCLFSWSFRQNISATSKSTIQKYNDLATPPRVMRKIKKPVSQTSTPVTRRNINVSPSPSTAKSPAMTRLQSTAKMTPSKLSPNARPNLSPSPGSSSTPLRSKASTPRMSTFNNANMNSPSPTAKRSSILVTNKTRLQESNTKMELNKENKVSTGDLVRQLRLFRENMDSYTQEDIMLVKREVKLLFNYEEEILTKYNSVVLDAVKQLINNDSDK